VAEGAVRPGAIWVRDQKIVRVELDGNSGGMSPKPPTTAPGRVLDVGDLVVMPGLVDTHVHVNEPGRTDWEGFASAGRAAAAGGITTIVVMPLNCTPAATNVAALMGEAEAAAGKCLVDYGFWGGVVPGNVKELEPMWEAGALGFKCFMVDSGVEDFPAISTRELFQWWSSPFERLRAPLLVHAEDPGVIADAAKASGLSEHPRSYSHYLASRPPLAEQTAVADLAWWPTAEGIRVHVVHVAETDRVPKFINETKKFAKYGYAMTGETCPHYLTFCSEEIPDGATQFKCAPPIRDRVMREALWEALRDGTLSMVVSDHSPCPPALKLLAEGDFARAWGGISSLQLGLAATWTGARTRAFGLPDVARWMCENPAKLAGIGGRKGRIAPGYDADLVVFNPDKEWTVRAEALHHRHKLTPYDGMTLRGVVKRTILRGRTVYDVMDVRHDADARAGSPCYFSEPIGQWIKRDSK
jgi:allantoinase